MGLLDTSHGARSAPAAPPPTSPLATDAEALAALDKAVAELSDLSKYDLDDPGRPAYPSHTSAAYPGECDIVMKGGITSGVVYPLGICELATTHRLRSIGGSSAGAIAAVIAAAAEYRRNETGSGAGFAQMAKLPRWFGDHLLGLFQPSPRTAPLFRLLLAATKSPSTPSRTGAAAPAPTKTGLRIIVAALTTWQFLAGFVVTVAILAGATLAIPGSDRMQRLWLLAPTIVGLALVIGLFCILRRLWKSLAVDVPDNFFGICRGQFGPAETPTSSGQGPGERSMPLTTWLSEQVSLIAGLDRPPTFADLWGPKATAAQQALTEASGPDEIDNARGLRNVDLLTTTSNVSNGVSARIPFARKPGHHNRFLFCPTDFALLFPPDVVDQMNTQSVAFNGQNRGTCPKHPDIVLRHLPYEWDLPIIVAARMSLSFPVLISAVRLYAMDVPHGHAEPIALPVWFSDGGICSNFPIHFFDSVLPRRPTFAFDLDLYPKGRDPELINSASPGSTSDISKNTGPSREDFGLLYDLGNPLPDDVTPIPPPDGGAHPPYADQRSNIFKFVSAIADTMQNNRDRAQAMLPGFRDRIAHVHHAASEGGMNLQMPAASVARMALRGRLGAQLLTGTKDPKVGFNWTGHRWVRYRMGMASLQRVITPTTERLDEPVGHSYDDLVIDYGKVTAGWTDTRIREATSAGNSLTETADGWDSLIQRPFMTDTPNPLAELRLQPPV